MANVTNKREKRALFGVDNEHGTSFIRNTFTPHIRLSTTRLRNACYQYVIRTVCVHVPSRHVLTYRMRIYVHSIMVK